MFAFGWAWPGLFNLSVVRDNPSAPAAATGVTQTGIYIGAGGGPVLGGMIVRTAGFSALWVSASFGLLIAAVAALVLRILLRRNRQELSLYCLGQWEIHRVVHGGVGAQVKGTIEENSMGIRVVGIAARSARARRAKDSDTSSRRSNRLST